MRALDLVVAIDEAKGLDDQVLTMVIEKDGRIFDIKGVHYETHEEDGSATLWLQVEEQ